ncbi:hypothetical protein BC332_00991 [Capsicum chinense]|nr:hypothetical protein BC332_00991 [Capsicum chinense]
MVKFNPRQFKSLRSVNQSLIRQYEGPFEIVAKVLGDCFRAGLGLSLASILRVLSCPHAAKNRPVTHDLHRKEVFHTFWKPKEAEMGNNSRPMDIVRELTEDSRRVFPSGVPLARYHIEQDADIVHIKVLCNNAFVTVTDSKGNRKFGATAGKLTGKGTKIARYAAESIAEHVGREARDRGLKSVVMKL